MLGKAAWHTACEHAVALAEWTHAAVVDCVSDAWLPDPARQSEVRLRVAVRADDAMAC